MISTRFHFQPRTSQKRPPSSDKQPLQLVPVSSKVICLPHRMRRRLSPRDMPQPSSNRFRTNFLRPPQRQARGFTDRLRCSAFACRVFIIHPALQMVVKPAMHIIAPLPCPQGSFLQAQAGESSCFIIKYPLPKKAWCVCTGTGCQYPTCLWTRQIQDPINPALSMYTAPRQPGPSMGN